MFKIRAVDGMAKHLYDKLFLRKMMKFEVMLDQLAPKLNLFDNL